MRDALTRHRSPRALLAVMVFAWFVAVGTLGVSGAVTQEWLRVPMALVMLLGIGSAAACLLKLLVQTVRR